MERPNIFPTKAAARGWGLSLRTALPDHERVALGHRIVARLCRSREFQEATTILTYVGSMPGELDTRPIIEGALHRGKAVLVPITRPGGIMEWSTLLRLKDLERSPRGILEPRVSARDLVTPTSGLCVVPGVCFRRDGHRVGFGGGYYDRFLAGFGGLPVAICPAMFYGVEFPVESHDRCVSVVVTESTLYRLAEPISG